MVLICVMVDGSFWIFNGPILAHQMPLAGAVNHITVTPVISAVSWVQTILGVTLLTSLYGFFVKMCDFQHFTALGKRAQKRITAHSRGS